MRQRAIEAWLGKQGQKSEVRRKAATEAHDIDPVAEQSFPSQVGTLWEQKGSAPKLFVLSDSLRFFLFL